MTTLVEQNGVVTADSKDSRPSIVEALSLVMNEIRAVGKTGRNTSQNYDFRGIDAVMNAAGPALRKHNVVAMPIVEHIEHRDVKTAKGAQMREVTMRVRYRFHGPRGDCLDAVVCSEALDVGDKCTAKAMSVAFRTALLQVLCLPTHDTDPDSQSYERGRGSVSAAEAKEQRDAERPSREALLEQVLATAEEVRQLREESEYAGADRLVKYCQERLGVNVIKTQSDEGAVEEIDLTRLKDGQLTLLLGVIRKSIKQLKSDGQEV